MINVIKTALLELVDDQVIKSVIIGYEAEVEASKLNEPMNLPSVLLYNGACEYSASDRNMKVRQIADQRIVMVLHCRTDQAQTLERQLVQKVQGLKKSEQDYPLEAVKSATVDLEGDYTSRRIELSSESKCNQVFA